MVVVCGLHNHMWIEQSRLLLCVASVEAYKKVDMCCFALQVKGCRDAEKTLWILASRCDIGCFCLFSFRDAKEMATISASRNTPRTGSLGGAVNRATPRLQDVAAVAVVVRVGLDSARCARAIPVGELFVSEAKAH